MSMILILTAPQLRSAMVAKEQARIHGRRTKGSFAVAGAGD
jgi:hypothetical protein